MTWIKNSTITTSNNVFIDNTANSSFSSEKNF